MKKIKLLMLVITAVIIFVAGYFFYLNNLRWKNVRNSENIRIGMSTQEVIEIMGLPEEVLKSYVADSDFISRLLWLRMVFKYSFIKGV